MKLSTSILLLLISLNLPAQLTLKSSYSIGGSSFESTAGILETTDNKVLIAGSSSSSDLSQSDNIGSSDVILIQTDETGNIEWIKNYGGTESDIAHDIIKSNEGGYLLAGSTESSVLQINSNKGESDVWIMKLNDAGNIQWQLTVGDTLWDDSRKVIQNSEGDYLILSRSHQALTADDCMLTKVDQQGNLVWNKLYGGTKPEWPTTILETTDGYLIVGSSESDDMDVSGNNGEVDYWVFKIDEDGNKLWDSHYGGLGSEVATSAINTHDGNIVIVGRAYNVNPSDNNGDYWIMKIDQEGTLIWDNYYGGAEIENPSQVIETEEQELLIAGYSSSSDGDLKMNHGNNDFWFLQLDKDGGILNSLSFGGSMSDRLLNINKIGTKIMVTGHSYSDDIDVLTNNGFTDIWYGEIGLRTSLSKTSLQPNVNFFPNPAHQSLSVTIPSDEKIISFSLMTIDGKLIRSSNTDVMNTTGVDSGYYIAQLKTNSGNYQQKIIVK